MDCPWCSVKAAPRGLHAHLVESHPEKVVFGQRAGGTRFYAIECPLCGVSYDQRIKPRLEDPGFLEEFSAEIRMVAFDMLVNHLVAEHDDVSAGGPQ